MRVLGNIIWHVPFLGFITALFTFLIGGLLVLTVVGAPLGFGLIQLSKFLLAPFSNQMISQKDLQAEQNSLWKYYGFIVQIVYFPFGLLIAILTVFQIIGLFLSLIGIPVALVLSKSLHTYFNPVNKVCVPIEVADEISARKARDLVDKRMAG